MMKLVVVGLGEMGRGGESWRTESHVLRQCTHGSINTGAGSTSGCTSVLLSLLAHASSIVSSPCLQKHIFHNIKCYLRMVCGVDLRRKALKLEGEKKNIVVRQLQYLPTT